MEAMQETQAIRSNASELKRIPVRTVATLAFMLGATMGSCFGAQSEPARESPLVSCMVKKASPQAREAVARAVQEGIYCPPPQLHPNEAVACPPAENNRALVKRAVFDLAKECSREFPSRDSLPSIEDAFIDSLRKDDTVKDTIEKRRAAYEKSKADFERTRAVNAAADSKNSSIKQPSPGK